MESNPYIGFPGTCEEAFKFYEKHLGVKIEAMIKCGDTPAAEKMPANWAQKIIHGRMTIGNSVVMAGDMPPDHYKQMTGVSITLRTPDIDEANRIYKTLSEGAQKVIMPIQETFYSPAYGWLTDKFGITWMILCERKM